MTSYEARYRLLRPLDHPLRQHVYRTLRRLEREAGRPLGVLDVGGRRSQYTIGLASRVTITDIPRETSLQEHLDLGATDDLRERLTSARTNVEAYLIDDLTQTTLAPASFDVAVAIEVIEHVDDDDTFIRNLARVLKPGGTAVLSTPNGDFRPTPYPDHRRHYTRAGLLALLQRHFATAEVGYLVNASPLMSFGTRTPSLRNPLRTLAGTAAMALAANLERLGAGGTGPDRKLHLVASARAAA